MPHCTQSYAHAKEHFLLGPADLVLEFGLGFLCVLCIILIYILFVCFVFFPVFGVGSLVCFELSVLVQVISCKDSSPK